MRLNAVFLMGLVSFSCSGDPVGKGPPTDSGPPEETGQTDTTPVPLEISDVAWTLHEELGSIVQVTWTQTTAASVQVVFGLAGEAVRQTPLSEYPAGPNEALLLGLPYDTDLTFQVLAGDVQSAEIAAKTGVLPEGVPVPVLGVSDASAWAAEDRWLLIGVSGQGSDWDVNGFWKLILDREGRVVWAHPTPGGYRTFYMQPSRSGKDILWDEDTFWTDFDKGAGSVVHRMKIDGTITETVPTPGLHHAYIELQEGVIFWGGRDNGQEVLRERDTSGKVRQVWDCSAYWREQGMREPCDGNGLFWNEADDTIYFSSDSGHTVVEVRRTTGELLHVWGQLASAWPFAEEDDTFWKQHSPTRTPEGNLLVSAWPTEGFREPLAREYEIDEENQVLREVWSCGQGSGIRADYAGEAHRLANGNTLLNFGGGSAIHEYTPDCTLVWSLDWSGQRMTSRGLFIADLYDFAP